MPMWTLPHVSRDGEMVEPVEDLEAMDINKLKDLAKAYRVFSDMDSAEEFGQYDGKIEISRDQLIRGLNRTPTTATHVCVCIVKPDTLREKCSYADMLVKREEDTGVVAQPTVFVSYAWRYSFIDLVETLQDHFKDKSPAEREKMYFWNDIFVED